MHTTTLLELPKLVQKLLVSIKQCTVLLHLLSYSITKITNKLSLENWRRVVHPLILLTASALAFLPKTK
jgi:hypothetical protein